MNYNNELAILVISCDKYKSCWDPFFKMFFKQWKEYDGKIYLGNNYEDYQYEDKNIEVIHIGEDKSWCENVKNMIEHIDEKYVLVMLEDYIFKKTVDDSIIRDAFELMKKENAGYYRFYTNPRGSKKYKGLKLHREILPTDYYCVNTGIGIWDKQVYLQLLHDGYSAWDFEIKNSKQANVTNALPALFLSSNKNRTKVINGITSGKWMPECVRFLKKNGIEVDTSQFAVMKGKQLFMVKAKSFFSKLLPKGLKRFAKKILCKLGFKKYIMDEY